jgi:hypothetical protein
MLFRRNCWYYPADLGEEEVVRLLCGTKWNFKCNSVSEGCAMTQAVIRRPLILEARV